MNLYNCYHGLINFSQVDFQFNSIFFEIPLILSASIPKFASLRSSIVNIPSDSKCFNLAGPNCEIFNDFRGVLNEILFSFFLFGGNLGFSSNSSSSSKINSGGSNFIHSIEYWLSIRWVVSVGSYGDMKK